jgi:hypothetical protein
MNPGPHEIETVKVSTMYLLRRFYSAHSPHPPPPPKSNLFSSRQINWVLYPFSSPKPHACALDKSCQKEMKIHMRCILTRFSFTQIPNSQLKKTRQYLGDYTHWGHMSNCRPVTRQIESSRTDEQWQARRRCPHYVAAATKIDKLHTSDTVTQYSTIRYYSTRTDTCLLYEKTAVRPLHNKHKFLST